MHIPCDIGIRVLVLSHRVTACSPGLTTNARRDQFGNIYSDIRSERMGSQIKSEAQRTSTADYHAIRPRTRSLIGAISESVCEILDIDLPRVQGGLGFNEKGEPTGKSFVETGRGLRGAVVKARPDIGH